LGNRLIRFLGDVSYSVFLLHLTVIASVTRILGYPRFSGSMCIVFIVTLLVTVPAAALAYQFVESPTMRLRRWVPARRASSRTQLPSDGLATSGH
jgi:peptidoglycan/LPS O-acetylase OafA/YrhL